MIFDKRSPVAYVRSCGIGLTTRAAARTTAKTAYARAIRRAHSLLVHSSGLTVFGLPDGTSLLIDAASPFQAWTRALPTYNMPFLGLIGAAATALGRGVVVVDVGAGVGDTARLALAHHQSQIRTIYCIEADPEFFELLQANATPKMIPKRKLLGDESGDAPSLVRHHAGTSAPQGDLRLQTETLDDVLLGAPVDVLKTDVDGFDGRVLRGARRTLRQNVPFVLFEWHPQLYSLSGSDLYEPFKVLEGCGYSDFVFFNKYGMFAFAVNQDQLRLDRLAEICLEGGVALPDWHFDVAAVPPHHGRVVHDVATQRFAIPGQPLRQEPPVVLLPPGR